MLGTTPFSAFHLGSLTAKTQEIPRAPALGSVVVGTAKAGSLRPSPAFQPLQVPFQRSLGGAHPDLYLRSPILQFYDFTAPSGAVLRVVDFGDAEAITVPGNVDFDSNEYIAVKLGRPDIEEARGGRVPQMSVAIADPTRALLRAMLDVVESEDAEVRVRIISYDDLSNPALAHEKLFRVRNVASLEGPARLAVTLGGPDLLEASFPVIPYNRAGCHNAYELRFDHAPEENYCSYPSDEFEASSAQNFALGTSDAERELEHGWHVLNRTKLLAAESGLGVSVASNGYLQLDGTSSSLQWFSSLRQGPYVYKIIQDSVDSDANIDVDTMLALISITSSTFAGLLVQSRDDPSTWLFVGRQSTLTGEVATIVTVAGSSVLKKYGAANLVHSFRVRRSGSSWSLYARGETSASRAPSSGSWSLLEDALVPVIGSINVGLAVLSDVPVVSDLFVWRFYHMRFAAGGFRECDRSDRHCTERKNLAQRNAYLGLPDGVVGF